MPGKNDVAHKCLVRYNAITTQVANLAQTCANVLERTTRATLKRGEVITWMQSTSVIQARTGLQQHWHSSYHKIGFIHVHSG